MVAKHTLIIAILLVLVHLFIHCNAAEPSHHSIPPNRKTKSSSDQIEEGTREGGNGPSVWNIFSSKRPGVEDGVSTGQQTALDWLFMCPKGIRSLMLYIIEKYRNPTIYNPGSAGKSQRRESTLLNRNSFPANFLFGAASSAYQFEGAAKEGGRGPSIWDTFTRERPDKIADHSNGDVAVDFYHRYKEDVRLMKFIGLNSFRFSISWSRVLPGGKLSAGVNKAGIAFYNNLINELLSKGIQPVVTMFHWDSPQALEDEYGGFLSPQIVDDFRDYAELCFKQFGDRVRYWTTFNEPFTFTAGGYDSGTYLGTQAPGRCSAWMNKGCPAGDSSTEPYLVAHHILLSHATVVKLYRDKYKASQKGQVGISLGTNWMVPYSNSKADMGAAKRVLDFFYGWFLDPLTYGGYPKVMRNTVGKRLPNFTPEQSMLLKGSIDFLGLNYYTSTYAQAPPFPPNNGVNISYSTDIGVNIASERNGIPIGEPTGIPFLYVYPQGLKQLLLYTKEKYKNPNIYITENGFADSDVSTIKQGNNDTQRIVFYIRHLSALKAAIDDGVNVKGFFAWSLLDAFEWGLGFTFKFGLNYVDFEDELKRYPKHSALWLKKFLS